MLNVQPTYYILLLKSFSLYFPGFSRPLSRKYRATTSVHVDEPQTVESEGMYQTQRNFIEDNIKRCAIFFHNYLSVLKQRVGNHHESQIHVNLGQLTLPGKKRRRITAKII